MPRNDTWRGRDAHPGLAEGLAPWASGRWKLPKNPKRSTHILGKLTGAELSMLLVSRYSETSSGFREPG